MKTKKTKLTKTEIKTCLWFWFGKLYIRIRDTNYDGFGYCISCGKEHHRTELQAGHYIPNATCKIHTRSEDNINGQCLGCNYNLHGNVHWYRDSLILKIGKERVEALEDTKNDLRQRKEYELIDMINLYRAKVLTFLITKSSETQQHILDYIKKNDKKMWNILYGNLQKDF